MAKGMGLHFTKLDIGGGFPGMISFAFYISELFHSRSVDEFL